jgi:hypothetical protein
MALVTQQGRRIQSRRGAHHGGEDSKPSGSAAMNTDLKTGLNTGLLAVGLIAAALLMTAGVIKSAPVRTGAAVEMQTGPVILAFAAPQGPVRVVAVANCLSAGCPLIELRIRRSEPETSVRVHLTA